MNVNRVELSAAHGEGSCTLTNCTRKGKERNVKDTGSVKDDVSNVEGQNMAEGSECR